MPPSVAPATGRTRPAGAAGGRLRRRRCARPATPAAALVQAQVRGVPGGKDSVRNNHASCGEPGEGAPGREGAAPRAGLLRWGAPGAHARARVPAAPRNRGRCVFLRGHRGRCSARVCVSVERQARALGCLSGREKASECLRTHAHKRTSNQTPHHHAQVAAEVASRTAVSLAAAHAAAHAAGPSAVLAYYGSLLLTAAAAAAAATTWQGRRDWGLRRPSEATPPPPRLASAPPTRVPPFAGSNRGASLYGVDVSASTALATPLARRAAAYAAAAHAGQFRRSGEPYVSHCVETAAIVEALLADGAAPSPTSPPSPWAALAAPPPTPAAGADAAIVAALLHDVPDDTPIATAALAAEFGGSVGSLVAAVSRLSRACQLLRRSSARGDAAAARALVVASVSDPRCIIIKLADRLHNMRTLWALPPAKRGALAAETERVWAPLAARLGMFALQGELEDLAFAVADPQAYSRLRASLDAASGPPPTPRPLPPGAATLGGDAAECAALLASVPPFTVTSFERPPGKGAGARARAAAAAAAAADGAPCTTGPCAPPALGALWTAAGALLREVAVDGQATGLDVRVAGRLKSAASVARKAARKGVTPEEVLDARALRVVVSATRGADTTTNADDGAASRAAAVAACYRIHATVRRLWRPIAGEDDDYILAPKPSGYQSLHTAVVDRRAARGRRGAATPAPFEVQLRTGAQHAAAETGAAAHWAYKEAGVADAVPAPRAGERAAPRLARGDAVVRVSGGKLQLGAVLGVTPPPTDGKAPTALVAVRVAPRLDLAGAPVPRSAVDALLAAAVAGGFDAPGRGNLRTKVEEYVPASDGRWHRVDAFGRVLPTTVAPVSPSAGGDSDAGAATAAATTTPSSSPVSAAMGDRIRLLRAMLAWTKDVEAGGSGGRSAGEGAAAPATPTTELPSSEQLLVLVWPPGAIASVRRGTTAGALAAERRAPEAGAAAPALAAMGAGASDRAPPPHTLPPPPPVAVNVNNRLVPPDTPLADGDFVVLTGAILENL